MIAQGPANFVTFDKSTGDVWMRLNNQALQKIGHGPGVPVTGPILLSFGRVDAATTFCRLNGEDISTSVTAHGQWNGAGFGWNGIDATTKFNEFGFELFQIEGYPTDDEIRKLDEYLRYMWNLYPRVMPNGFDDLELDWGNMSYVPSHWYDGDTLEPGHPDRPVASPMTAVWMNAMWIHKVNMAARVLREEAMTDPYSDLGLAYETAVDICTKGGAWVLRHGLTTDAVDEINGVPGVRRAVYFAPIRSFWMTREQMTRTTMVGNGLWNVDESAQRDINDFPFDNWAIFRAVDTLGFVNQYVGALACVLEYNLDEPKLVEEAKAAIQKIVDAQLGALPLGHEQNRFGHGNSSVRVNQSDQWIATGPHAEGIFPDPGNGEFPVMSTLLGQGGIVGEPRVLIPVAVDIKGTGDVDFDGFTIGKFQEFHDVELRIEGSGEIVDKGGSRPNPKHSIQLTMGGLAKVETTPVQGQEIVCPLEQLVIGQGSMVMSPVITCSMVMGGSGDIAGQPRTDDLIPVELEIGGRSDIEMDCTLAIAQTVSGESEVTTLGAVQPAVVFGVSMTMGGSGSIPNLDPKCDQLVSLTMGGSGDVPMPTPQIGQIEDVFIENFPFAGSGGIFGEPRITGSFVLEQEIKGSGTIIATPQIVVPFQPAQEAGFDRLFRENSKFAINLTGAGYQAIFETNTEPYVPATNSRSSANPQKYTVPCSPVVGRSADGEVETARIYIAALDVEGARLLSGSGEILPPRQGTRCMLSDGTSWTVSSVQPYQGSQLAAAYRVELAKPA